MLYYIHGYLSAPDSTKGSLLKKTLGVIPVKYRDCEPEELVISDCVNRIKEAVRDDENVVLIGSSLGGLLAAKTAKATPVKTLILLNPAIIPTFVDITKIQDLPQRILQDMQDERLFSEKINSKIIVLVGRKDVVVPNSWPVEFAKTQDASIRFFNDDHSFTMNLKNIPSIIRSILDEKD